MKLEYWLHLYAEWRLIKDKMQVSDGHSIIYFYTVGLRPG